MENDYIQDFVNAAIMNEIDEARAALDCGLNQQKDFNFSNPRVFFSILNTRSEEIVHLVVEYGFNPNELLKLAEEHNSKIVIHVLQSLVLANKLDNELNNPETEKKKIKL